MTSPIKLPPLPTPDADHYDTGTFDPVWKKGKMEAYATAAIEADRKLRGEPVSPEGFRLIAVNETFDSLMYWLDRCEQKGHLENCADLTEPWEKFEYREVEAPQPAELDVLPGEAVFGFAAWLTSLKTPVTFSECHGAAIGAELAVAYNTSQGFIQVREDFHKRLKPYPKDEPSQPAEPVKVG